MGTTSLGRRPRRIALVVVLSLAASGCSSAGGGTADRAPTSAHRPPPTTAVKRPPLPPSTVATPPSARVTQPAQPTAGPGSSDLPFHGWRVSSGGSGADGWYVFEPAGPKPATAPVAVIMHGYYEYSGYDQMYELIRHTVLSGSIVIYPRWQTDVATPCPGPFDIEPCVAAATRAIHGALRFLRTDTHRVQPEIDRTSYFGFSFGGIITVDLANRHRQLGLPTPRAIFLDDPHDGGLTGTTEPAVDHSLAGIPSSVLLVCHVGAEGVTAAPRTANASCNAIFPKLGAVPRENKALVLTEPDRHGQPALSSTHGVCTARRGHADAYDWSFCWKVWDALRSAALDHGTGRRFALRQHRRATQQRRVERRHPHRGAEGPGRQPHPPVTPGPTGRRPRGAPTSGSAGFRRR
ncbi:MAG: hypothetical protein JWM05_1030 [Acidimicrobiales bacterium]|nr:hypothetical protein [Acidimicrobiales bacterium]